MYYILAATVLLLNQFSCSFVNSVHTTSCFFYVHVSQCEWFDHGWLLCCVTAGWFLAQTHNFNKSSPQRNKSEEKQRRICLARWQAGASREGTVGHSRVEQLWLKWRKAESVRGRESTRPRRRGAWQPFTSAARHLRMEVSANGSVQPRFRQWQASRLASHQQTADGRDKQSHLLFLCSCWLALTCPWRLRWGQKSTPHSLVDTRIHSAVMPSCPHPHGAISVRINKSLRVEKFHCTLKTHSSDIRVHLHLHLTHNQLF